MNEMMKQKIIIIAVAYFVGFSLLGVGYYLGTTQTTNNYYYEDKDSYIDLSPFGNNATCQACYLSSEIIYLTSEELSYNIHLNNLTLNHSYMLILPEEVILFTYFYENELQDLFALTYLTGESSNVTIRLFEVFTNPFIYKLSEMNSLHNFVLLDVLVINLEL